MKAPTPASAASTTTANTNTYRTSFQTTSAEIRGRPATAVVRLRAIRSPLHHRAPRGTPARHLPNARCYHNPFPPSTKTFAPEHSAPAASSLSTPSRKQKTKAAAPVPVSWHPQPQSPETSVGFTACPYGQAVRTHSQPGQWPGHPCARPPCKRSVAEGLRERWVDFCALFLLSLATCEPRGRGKRTMAAENALPVVQGCVRGATTLGT